jgi:hypothetical protein
VLCGLLPPHYLRRDLLDVAHQALELPLCVHVGLAAQREAIQLLAVPDVRKHQLDRGDALASQSSTVG